MERTICVWLLAFLALGWAVPVPESASLTQEDLLSMIHDADPNENDISKPAITTNPPAIIPENEDSEASRTGIAAEDGTLPSDAPTDAPPEEISNEDKPVLKEMVNQTQISNETHVHAPSDEQATEDKPEPTAGDEPLEVPPNEEQPVPVGNSQDIPALPQDSLTDEEIEKYFEEDAFEEDLYSPTVYEEPPLVHEPSLPLFEEPFIFAKEMDSETFEEQPQVENEEPFMPEIAEPLSFDEQPSIPVLEEQPQFEDVELVLPGVPEPLPFDEQPNVPFFEEQSQFEDDELVLPEIPEPLPFDEEANIPIFEDEEPALLEALELLPFGEDPVDEEQPNFEDGEPIMLEDPLPFSEEPFMLEDPLAFNEEPIEDPLAFGEEPVVFNFEEEAVLPEAEEQVVDGDESIFETEMSFEDNERITQILGDKEVTISFIEPVLIGPEYTHVGEEELPFEISAGEQMMPSDEEGPQLDNEDMLTLGLEDNDEMHMIENPEEIRIIIDDDPLQYSAPEVPIIPGFVSPAEPGDEFQMPSYFGFFDTTDDMTLISIMPDISEEPVMVNGLGDFPMEQSDFPFEENQEVFDDVREDYFIPEDKLTVEDTFSGNEEEPFDDLFPVMPVAPMAQRDDSLFTGDNAFVNFQAEMEAPQENTEENFSDGMNTQGIFIIENNPPPMIPFGEPLPSLGNGVPLPPLGNFGENAFITDDLEDSDDYDQIDEQIVPNTDFLPDTNIEGENYSPFGIPINFPQEMPPQHNLPVFPQQWNEENYFGVSSDGDVYPNSPSSFGSIINSESSYADYNPLEIMRDSLYGPLPGPSVSYGPPSKPSFSYSQILPFPSFTSDENGPSNDIQQHSFPMSGSNFMGEMQSDDIEPQVPEMFGGQDMPLNEDDSHFHGSDDVFQNPDFPLAPQRFNNFGSSRMPSLEEIIATRYDIRGPSTFPFNIRNPYPGSNINFNRVYEAFFNEPQSSNPMQSDEAYGIRSPLTPYETYQAGHFDSRYPVSSLPNTFDIYRRFPYGFPPYGSDGSYRRPGIYSSRPLNRYALGDRYEPNPYYGTGFPVPTW